MDVVELRHPEGERRIVYYVLDDTKRREQEGLVIAASLAQGFLSKEGMRQGDDRLCENHLMNPQIWCMITTLNETEAQILTGVEVKDLRGALAAIEVLKQYDAKRTIVTLGAKGLVFEWHGNTKFLRSHKVEVVDTTAAGNTFAGALAASLARGEDLEEAVKYANCAAALSVTKSGAQTSLPTAQEVAEFIKTNKWGTELLA